MSKTNPINSIICGDCRDRMREHIDDESIDLIYLDPPFFSGKDYDLIWKKKGSKDKVKTQAFGDTAKDFGHSDCKSTIGCFEEAGVYKKVCGVCNKDWGTKANGDPYARCIDGKCNATLSEAKDIRMNDVEIYVGWLKERLEECHRVLKPTGSIYCHLDYHAVHYVKVVMDEIFGYGNLRSEIIWRIGWVSGFKTQKKGWIRNHDTILYYVKSDKYTFNKEYLPYPEDYVRRDGKKPTGKGVPLEDTWNCNVSDPLNSINIMSFSREKLGYPTQKPESLLERIIKASSNEGDTILDPFCGCGTAIKVAQDLNRKWVGIDIEPISCSVMQFRMKLNCGINVPIHGLPIAPDNPYIIDPDDVTGIEFQRWIVDIIDGEQAKKPNETFDGFIRTPLLISNDGSYELNARDPIEVKKFDKVGTKYISKFAFDLMHHGKKAGLFVALGFAKTTIKEVEDIRSQHDITIKLMTFAEVLDMTAGRISKTSRKTIRKGTQTTISDASNPPKKPKNALRGSKLTDKQREHLKEFGYVNIARNGKEHRITPSRVVKGVIK